MALKSFRDEQGNEWRVWDVVPYRVRTGERREGADRRRGGVHGYNGPERRTGQDRRARTPGMAAGWLCFENGDEKRRLTPIPTGWDEAPLEELQGLLGRARGVPRRLGCDERAN
jgi:hypothetical protein